MHKLLIIDDEEKLRSLMARILSLEGYEVKEARDMQSAWKMLDKESFEVVLSDVKLPDGNGVELASRIKSRFPLTEIILLTAYGNIPDGVQAIKNGLSTTSPRVTTTIKSSLSWPGPLKKGNYRQGCSNWKNSWGRSFHSIPSLERHLPFNRP